jgi:WD40 repeat protein
LNSTTHEVLHRLEGHHCAANEIDWSPIGDRLVSSSSDGSIRIWDIQAESLLIAYGGTAATAEADPFYGVTWNSSGDWIASYQGIAAFLINPIDGNIGTIFLQDASQEPDFLTSIRWSPDGNTLAATTRGNQIHFWDARTDEQQVEPTLTISNISMRSIAWHPQGSILAVGGQDGTIRLLDTVTGRVVSDLIGYTDPITTMEWDITGDRLASGSSYHTIRVWDVATEQVIKTASYTDTIWAISWQPNNDTIAFGSESDTADAQVEFLSLDTS